ncbi:Endonuclease/exonuclease/phosphatase [Phycomyces blakesleeanus]|uniref:Endonuclease/exonuclease/phosphatase n=1 Tax=Phycomyces blakesleeanus TaxID=4837 RepID=A0ABR3B6D1_PHYBL
METNTEAYIRYDPTKETAWVNAVFAAFGEKKSSYYKVASQQLVTMLLIVIAKKEHSQDICEVETNYTGVGLMNMMGNKGGVAVRLRYHDSYFCFITSHLAAFVDKVEKRNQDFTSIAKRLVFRNYPDDILAYLNFSWNSGGDEGVSFLESNGVSRKWTKDASIFHADHLIWLGDLNYRVNLSEAEIKMRLQQGELDYLLEYDQARTQEISLSIERQAGRTFSMFDEGRIEFTPTYKFDAGTNQYDTSEKRRAPSWTDRILWKKSENEDKPSKKRQNLLSYDSCMKMMTSDHKPVRALFETNVRKINHQKLALTKDKLIKRLVATKDQTPKATLVNSFVKFGDVQFMEFKERSIVLENTGLVLVTFRFKSKLSDIDEYDNSEFDQNKNADQTSEEIIPSWLTVHPTSGVLGPGEKVVIQFELMIDPSISAPFNKREKDIDEVLVLRIKGGGDYFVIVEGKYQPTCFGVPLEDLASMPVPVNPIRYIPLQDSKNHTPVEPSVGDRQAQQVNLPKELWKVLNFLWNKNMLSIESLFLEHGDRVICHYIRQCMDTDSPFDSDILLGKDIKDEKPASSISEDSSENEESLEKEALGANSMVDVLVAFLECLPEPVIPTNMYKLALEAADSPEAMAILIATIPRIHLNVLHYINDFLRDAMKYAPESCKEYRRQRIVELFSGMIRPPVDFKERNPALAREKREKFVGQLLRT